MRLPKSSDHSVFTRRASSLRSLDEPPSFHSAHTRHPVHRGPEVRCLKNWHVSHQGGFWLTQKLLLTSFSCSNVQRFPFSAPEQKQVWKRVHLKSIINRLLLAAEWASNWRYVLVFAHTEHHSNRPCVKAPRTDLATFAPKRRASSRFYGKPKQRQCSKLAESQRITDFKKGTAGNWGQKQDSKL